MTRMWPKALVVLLLAAPVGVIAADPKSPPEKAVEEYDSETRGAIQVNGDTTDWFEVRKGGKAIGLVPKLLNGTWEVEPGEYEVVVNKTSRKVKVEAGTKVVLTTGTLAYEGKDALYYYPLVGEEKKVASNRNNPGPDDRIALFAGVYAVDANINTRLVRVTDGVKVTPGRKIIVKK